MRMIKLVRGRWTASLIVVAAMAMPLACKRSNADDNVPAATGAASAKASRPPSTDSVRATARAVPSAVRTGATQAHTVVFIGTSLTAGLGLNPDSAYPQLIQQ